MQKTSAFLVIFVLLLRVNESSAGKPGGSSGDSKKTSLGGKGSKTKHLDPSDLNKKILDVNSVEENLAERMIVYKDGKKRKPLNLNKSPKKFELAQRMDSHPMHKRKPQPPARRQKRLFVPENNLKWPNREIPYSIQRNTYRSLGNIEAIFNEAVEKFNDAACVTWIPRTTESTYINIVGNQPLCASYVGYGSGPSNVQDLWLYENGCVYVDIAIHEMLHAVGAMHEQSREADRDPIITYNWDAISSDAEFNYRGFKLTNARQYDLGSVLQYELTYGSTTYMISNDPDLAYLPRQMKNDLSFYDKAELNAFYQCADDCVNPPTCQNEGFVKQTGGVCSCVCVEGLTGDDCSQLDTSPGCGDIITLASGGSQQIAMSPYTAGQKCTWLIKGAEKNQIRLSVDSMDLPTNPQDACYHFLEVRDYLSGAPGKLICGNSGGGVFTKKRLGPTNMMVVRFDSDTYNTIAPGNGFTLTVEAVPSACSSNPCKYPATCVDGATTDDYTCECTRGYSGTNCDTVSASAEVTDSFEDDFTTLMRLVTTGVDFQWSTGLYFDMNGNQIQASNGHLMAQMISYFFSTPFYYASIAKMETSVIFESADRCLRFDYAISNRNLGSTWKTRLTVNIMSDSTTTPHVFNTNTGNVWTTAEIDLPAVSNLKVEFEGYFGDQELAVDNIRISPLSCNAPGPCDGVDCQNGGSCQVTSSSTFECQCQTGFSGQFCQNDVCSGNTCVNGACNPVSASDYTCQCDEGWYGENCDIDPCSTNDCVNGECVALSETETECQCNTGWSGTNCDIHKSLKLTSYTCDFEEDPEASCFLKESANDDFDFTRKSGGTLTRRTGPSGAASGNYYKYTEASSPRSRGDEASLESDVSFPAGTYCLSLSISMYGTHIGSLEILTKEGNSADVSHQIYSGNQGKNWFTYSKELSLTSLSKIIIRTTIGGKRKNSNKGDIAVDNIVLESGSCV
ncbi:uncharacterized protein LOC133176117 [Saccostrea echinata]|uniref:uncharacterized protein LOC133176117 n=1 Tax=Saccostrea echinata TaxID=191078 RepID=UPI002A8224A2|nr:uncharacterized protein LOC133176117 [Saccostrea echinata]